VAADDAAGALTSGPVGEAVFEGALYATNTAHHRAFDHVVLADAGLFPGARVLDLGCGSGDLTATVAGIVRDGGAAGSVLGLDASPTQVEHARAAFSSPGLEFAVGRAQQLAALVPEAAFDVVLSVATLHWVPGADQPAVLAAVVRALRPGGVFRADLGGAGQIAAARVVFDELSLRYGGATSPWFFPDEAQYAGLLRGAGLVVERATLLRQRRAMPTEEALEGWVRSQVLPAYLPALAPDARDPFAAEVVATLPGRVRRENGSFDQDYVRMDVLARRP
jgi:trans-aconitate 2-methyltransferase